VESTLDKYKDLNINRLRNKICEEFATNTEHFLKNSNGKELTNKIMYELIEHMHSTHLTDGRSFMRKIVGCGYTTTISNPKVELINT
jgi:hypothetical protein